MSLSGNMALKDMLTRKIHWKTQDDNKKKYKSNRLNQSSYNIIDMEPQRIRVFQVEYHSEK